MKLLAATIASLAVIASSAQAQEKSVVPKLNSMVTREDVRMVAPALDKYSSAICGNVPILRRATAASSRSPR